MSARDLPFHSIYAHRFLRVAAAVPRVRVADVAANVTSILDLAERADSELAAIVAFPELCITAYSNEDLFGQEALLLAALDGLHEIATASRRLSPALVVGLPLRIEQRLFNVAVVLHRGTPLGVVPKRYLPNYREFYEKRQFASARDLDPEATVTLLGHEVPVGRLLFRLPAIEGATLGVEICEDLWAPNPPSTSLALAGATVIANVSASNITIGKSDYRRLLAASQSGRCIAAYLYTAAGAGESTTDLAWDGEAMIYENANLIAESQRFAAAEELITADVDIAALCTDRMRITSFADAVAEVSLESRSPAARGGASAGAREVRIAYEPPHGEIRLRRDVSRFPYVPARAEVRDERCYETYNIQVNGLATRMRAAGIETMIVGISGGLDSTQALLVCAAVADELGLGREAIRAYTMPGFATSARTRRSALSLMEALGVQAGEIDIRPACMQMFRDIAHPYADGVERYDVTFENVQAGERTSLLFRLANLHRGLVVGTGDLSELALGWATYGVGDHMSHYAVNASLPKSLIQYVIRWVADTNRFGTQVSAILRDILDTEISPELVPGSSDDGPAQRSEATVGPYELQDFHLYYVTRYGFAPSRVAFLAEHAWADAERGSWPDSLPQEKRNSYALTEIKSWLRVFLTRFFATTQFKRSCIPNGPKVGSGGSLSPRGDWRAPSDSSAAVWLAELESIPEK